MMWYWGGGVHWWGWLVGFFGFVLFWGIVISVVGYFLGGTVRHPLARTRRLDSKDILDERLARGEIDAVEYQRLRRLIEEPSRPMHEDRVVHQPEEVPPFVSRSEKSDPTHAAPHK